jgi:hypothetical protein
MTKETRLLRLPLIHLDRFGDLPDRGPDVNRPAHVDVRERKKQSARVLKRRPNRIFNVEPVANEPDELRDVDYPEFAHSLAAMVLNRSLGDPEFFGDLLISHSGGDEPQNVALPRG